MPVLESNSNGYSVNASAKNLIKRALRILGAIDPGEEATAEELRDGLEGLNHMLDSWNTEELMIPAYRIDTFSTVAGDSAYSIGPGGDCDIPRPAKLEEGQVFITNGTLDYPALTAYDQQRWAEISDKGTTGLPAVFYYDKANPTGSLSFYYKPDQAYTVTLYSWTTLAQIAYADINAQFALNPGFARAIVYNLALDLADEFGAVASANVLNTASVAKANAKRLNIEPVIAFCDQAVLSRNPIFDINRGY